ncbi:radical SAM protein [Anaerocolumna sedimenticola]|uniref:Radical SAM protein n=1 Tax=Anaerocolumna sedimenticola TaxID=2696063 RepID=A0A6P1THJ5_9FIRM|nr:radical SAM/SPASM domain-containing protein [Anaerocolumna sedimenticola]QHQ60690.1 radical SAM protein [Anaerocolumna sedimenticola]
MPELKLYRDCTIMEKPPFPKNIMIELTNACNHKCIFCAHDKMKRKIGNCDKNFIFDIMKQARDAGAEEVGFYMTGEPFLVSALPDYVEKANQLKYSYIYITTNGVLANANKVMELYKKGLKSLKISINAGTKKTYEIIHGKDDFDKVIENLKNIKGLKKDNNINLPIFVSFVRNKLNMNEIDKLRNLIEDYIDQFVIYDAYNQGGNMYELNDTIMVDDFHGGIQMPCNMIFNRIHITYEGYLNACCVDFDNFMATSDLHKIKLIDAWNSDLMINLRRQHMSGNLKSNMCYNCINNKNTKIAPLNKELYEREIEKC